MNKLSDCKNDSDAVNNSARNIHRSRHLALIEQQDMIETRNFSLNLSTQKENILKQKEVINVVTRFRFALVWRKPTFLSGKLSCSKREKL